MRNALVAAIVAAVISAGSAGAAVGLISGAKIKPHSIASSKLTKKALAELGGSFDAASLKRVTGPTTTIAPSTSGSASVACPSGYIAIGGGGSSDLADLDASQPSGSNAWQVTFYNYATDSASANAVAICAKGSAK